MLGSRKGINIAFIGTNIRAQTACANYLKTNKYFRRLDMDSGLRRFLRTSYNNKPWANIPFGTKLEFYDAIYKVDPELFIEFMRERVRLSERDIVTLNVRYLNELRALQEMDFKIVRVTKPVKEIQPGKLVKTAAPGTVLLSMMYDRQFAINYDVEYTVNWTSKATTGEVMEALLERMGYNS